MAAPPSRSRLGQGRATLVKVDVLGEEHREYTRNLKGWQEKLPRSAGPLTWEQSGSGWNISATGKWPVALGHLNARPPEQLRETLPIPDGPITVGIDGGYVRDWNEKKSHLEVIVGKSILAFRREDEEDIPSSKCFGFVQTLDKKPKRRLFEVLKSQGHQMNQQITFLSARLLPFGQVTACQKNFVCLTAAPGS